MYQYMVDGPKPSLSIILKNIWFLIRNVPVASKKAEHHFYKAIEGAKEMGAKSFLGQAYLDLGLLYKTKKKTDKAKECISKSIRLFEEC